MPRSATWVLSVGGVAVAIVALYCRPGATLLGSDVICLALGIAVGERSHKRRR